MSDAQIKSELISFNDIPAHSRADKIPVCAEERQFIEALFKTRKLIYDFESCQFTVQGEGIGSDETNFQLAIGDADLADVLTVNGSIITSLAIAGVDIGFRGFDDASAEYKAKVIDDYNERIKADAIALGVNLEDVRFVHLQENQEIAFSTADGKASIAQLTDNVYDPKIEQLVADVLIDFSHPPTKDQQGRDITDADERKEASFIAALANAQEVIWDADHNGLWVTIPGAGQSEPEHLFMINPRFREIFPTEAPFPTTLALSGKNVIVTEPATMPNSIRIINQQALDENLRQSVQEIGDNNLDIVGTITVPLNRSEQVFPIEPIKDESGEVIVDCLPDFTYPADNDSRGEPLLGMERDFISGLIAKGRLSFDITKQQFEYFVDSQPSSNEQQLLSISEARLKEIYGSQGDFVVTMAMTGLHIFPRFDHEHHQTKEELMSLDENLKAKLKKCEHQLGIHKFGSISHKSL